MHTLQQQQQQQQNATIGTVAQSHTQDKQEQTALTGSNATETHPSVGASPPAAPQFIGLVDYDSTDPASPAANRQQHTKKRRDSVNSRESWS